MSVTNTTNQALEALAGKPTGTELLLPMRPRAAMYLLSLIQREKITAPDQAAVCDEISAPLIEYFKAIPETKAWLQAAKII
jgi:hypothetical protein